MPAKRCTFAVTVLCAAAVVVLVTAAPASAHPVLRGTTNSSVFNKGVENAPARLDFLAAKLRAQLLRVGLRWDLLEPQRGQFDQVYLDELATSFHAAAGDGLKIIVSLCGTPKWASDRTLWRAAEVCLFLVAAGI